MFELGKWNPLLALILATILGSMTYVWQKSVDRDEALSALRQQEYSYFISAYQNNISMSSPKSLAIYHQAMQRLFVIGSDDVILTVGALNDYLASTSGSESTRSVDEVRQLSVKVYKAMRNDCFEETQLIDNELEKLLPFR